MLALLACSPPGDPAPVDTGAAAFVALTPVWTPDEVVLVLDNLREPPAPSEALSAYLGLLAAGDASCPGSSSQLGGADLRGCTSATGYSYAGIASYARTDGGWILTGDFDITTPEGQRFVGGGAISESVDATGGWSSRWSGTWSFEGADGWLDPGVSTWWSQSAGAGWGQADDGLGNGQDLWFEALRSDPSRCDGLSGAVEVRDPSGGWWRVDHGTCAACGALSFEGQDQGEACTHLGDWLDRMEP